MQSNTKNKWQVRLAVMGIFIIGFVAGCMSMRVYRGFGPESASAHREGRFERLVDQLNLTPEQRTEVKAIFDEARTQLMEVRKQSEPNLKAVRERTDERMRAVLTPEQWEQFQKLMNKAKSRRRHDGDAAVEQPLQ